jgi:hypothetical protein
MRSNRTTPSTVLWRITDISYTDESYLCKLKKKIDFHKFLSRKVTPDLREQVMANNIFKIKKNCYLAFQLCPSGSPHCLSHIVNVKDLQTSSNVPA